jgi:hypothetical protein
VISMWRQHEYRVTVEGKALRYCPYVRMAEIMSEMGYDMSELTEVARLKTRADLDDSASGETLMDLGKAVDLNLLRSGCFVEDMSAEQVRDFIERTPRTREAQEALESTLDGLLVGNSPECDGMVGGLLDLGVPWVPLCDMTIQQMTYLLTRTAKRLEAMQEAR